MKGPVSTRESQNRSGASALPAARGKSDSDELHKMNAYWRAANYVSVGQIYLRDNPFCASR